MQTLISVDKMTQALMKLSEGDEIAITIDNTEEIDLEVSQVHGSNSGVAENNPDAKFVVNTHSEAGDLYLIVSRPVKNSNHYSYELEVARAPNGAETAEYVGDLTKLQIPPQIKLYQETR